MSTWVGRACQLARVEGPFPEALADVHAEFERVHPFLDGNGRTGRLALMQRARPEPFFGKEPSSYSFPSGHALYSLCFYGVIASVLAAHAPDRATRIGIWGAAALLIVGIGLSRVYLGVHYPADVIAGYLSAAFVIGAVFAFSPGWS